MNEETKKLIADEFNSLPLEIKEAISRLPWENRLKEIVSENKLENEQGILLNIETTFVLFGLEPLENFQGNIAHELGLDENVAKKIYTEISEKIFVPIENQFTMIKALEPETGTQIKPPQKITPTSTLTKTTTLEIPPTMSLVPEGKVMDHLPPITPMQPKTIAPIVKYDSGKDPYREPLV